MVQTTVRLPAELYQELKLLAKRKGVTLNSLVVSALWDLLLKKGG